MTIEQHAEKLMREAKEIARRNAGIPDGYALISLDALRAWGKLGFVLDAARYPLNPASAQEEPSAPDEQTALVNSLIEALSDCLRRLKKEEDLLASRRAGVPAKYAIPPGLLRWMTVKTDATTEWEKGREAARVMVRNIVSGALEYEAEG